MPWGPRDFHRAASRRVRVKRVLQVCTANSAAHLGSAHACLPEFWRVTAGTRVAMTPHRRKTPMLTKLKLALLISAPLVAGATTYAFARGDASGAAKQERIQKFDQNGDGTLDDAERAQMKAAFAARRAERHKQ